MSNLLDIGLSGLQAAEYGLTTTSNNISNASTPGYSREIVQYQPAPGQYTGVGFLGTGVSVATVAREYSQYLNNQLNQAQSQGSALSTYASQTQQLSSAVGDPTTGITTGLQTFFSDLQAMANSASDGPTRTTLLGDTQSLVGELNSLNGQFDQQRQNVNTQITTTVTQINSYAQQIAQLNTQIQAASASGQTPNALLDQRDQAISNLGQLVGTTTVTDSSGAVNVFIGTGQSLVVGNQSFQLAAVTSPTDSSELTVAYAGQAGSGATPQLLSESSLQSGSLGGLLQFRSQTLDPEQQSLGALATTFAVTLNQANAQGVDLNGNAGGPIFSVAQPTTTPAAANTGTGVLSVTYGGDMSQLTGDNYTLSQVGAGNYMLTDKTTGVATPVTFSAGTPQTAQVDGLTLSLSGTPDATDSFTINSSTREAAGSVAVALTSGSQFAAGSPAATATAAAANTGGATIAASTAASGATPAGSVPLTAAATITVDATGQLDFPAAAPVNVTVGGTTTTYAAGTPVPVTAGATYSFSGISITLTGTPAVGDSFTVTPQPGAGDGSNALAMSNLATTSTMLGNTTFSGAYAQFVNTIGDIASQMQTSSTAQATLVTQVQAQQQSVSGVNLDEEATNLLQYQQMYQANSKVIQMASTLFSTLLDALQS